MKNKKSTQKKMHQNTKAVSDELFQAVYDAPSSLPGRFKWVTTDEDVREIEKILGMSPKTIGAPLWLSGKRKTCRKCKREANWLDIVASALDTVHGKAMIATVILGKRKFVNIEAPRVIQDVKCFKCNAEIDFLRSFKCHNWAYAKPALLRVLMEMGVR